MRLYHPTVASRLATAAAATALGSGGVAAILGASLGVAAIIILIPVGLTVGAVLSAVAEDRLDTALLIAVLSAPATYVFMVLQILSLPTHPRLGWLMIALACLAVAQAIAASALEAAPRHRAHHV